MTLKTFLDPLTSSLTLPVVSAFAFIGAVMLAQWLQTRKSAQLKEFGNLIEMAAGLAYKTVALRPPGMSGLDASAIEKQAIAAGVDALKNAATKAAGALPSDDVLTARVSGKLGTLLAVDPTISVVQAAPGKTA